MARTKPPPAPRPTARRPARGTAKPHRRRPAPRRPAPRRSLGPLLTPDQRRELAGIAAVGGGVVLAAVLAVPDGGTVAGPIHDGLLDGLGAGAWVLAAGAVVAGVRTLGRRGWTGGLLGALGTVTTVVALLGMLGLADAGAAGAVGQRIGPDIAARLGTAATGAAMLLVVCLGLVLAVDLRVGPLAARTWAWWLRQRERERAAAAAVQTPAAPDARRGAGADGEPVIEAVGRSRGRGATDRRAPAVFDPPSNAAGRFGLWVRPPVSRGCKRDNARIGCSPDSRIHGTWQPSCETWGPTSVSVVCWHSFYLYPRLST